MKKASVYLIGAVVVAAAAAAAVVGPTISNEPTSRPGGGEVKRTGFMQLACTLPTSWALRIHRGWEPGKARAHDLAVVPDPPTYAGGFVDAAHSGPYPFLQEVPLVLYGRGHIASTGDLKLDREVTVADLAPTFARLMNFGFPRRDGAVLREALKQDQAGGPPRLLVTAVIDGGGWNVLERWPNAWPNLARLMREGANLIGATVGSSPSITPAIHTNLSTGTWPRKHGVSAIVERADDGRLTGGFHERPRYAGAEIHPRLNLRATTLADLWDRANQNKPKVALLGFGNYVAGMLGHGHSLRGADRDIAILEEGGRWATDPDHFFLPGYLNTEVSGPSRDIQAVDRADGRLDGRWRGHSIEPLDATPAFAPWQQRTLRSLIVRERFGRDRHADLLYVNYKAPDAAGHRWNMLSVEQKDVIRSVDHAIAGLVRFLDHRVGRNKYVVAVTADHGQTPITPLSWPIDGDELKDDVATAFDDLRNSEGLFESVTAATYFLNRRELKANRVTTEQIASFLSKYKLRENIAPGVEVPDKVKDRLDENVFRAVIPGSETDEVVACTDQ